MSTIPYLSLFGGVKCHRPSNDISESMIAVEQLYHNSFTWCVSSDHFNNPIIEAENTLQAPVFLRYHLPPLPDHRAM